MKSALWIRDTHLYAELARKHSTAVSHALLTTVDAALCWTWQEEAIPHTSLWRYVTLDDQVQTAEEALTLADTWLEDGETLLHRGVPLGELGRTALLYTFRDALLARRMATGFLEDVGPDRLIIPTPASILEAVLGWEARKRNVDVETPIAPVATPSSRQKAASRLHRALQALWANGRFSMTPSTYRNPDQATLMFVGDGADFVNQLHVIARLRATRPYRVIHVCTNPPGESAYSRSQTVSQSPAIRLLPYRNLAEYVALRGLGQRAWQWFQTRRQALASHHGSLFGNPDLDDPFRAFFTRKLPRIGGVVGAAGRLLDDCAPDLVVLNNDASGQMQAVVYATRQRGIPSVQMIHSGFNDLHFRRFSTDEIWVWGEIHRQQLVSIGNPIGRIRIVGNPNYDYLHEPDVQSGQTRAYVRRQLDLRAEDLAFLLITAKPPHLLTFVDMEQHLFDLRVVCEALHGLPNVRMVIKPHPRYDDTAVYRQLAERYHWITLVENRPIDQLLPASDVAMMVNAASTGGIEALLFGKPLIWVRPSVQYPPSFLLFEPGILALDRRSEIAPTLQQFVRAPEFRQTVTRLGQNHLPHLISHLDGGATDAVLLAIDRAMQQKRGDPDD